MAKYVFQFPVTLTFTAVVHADNWTAARALVDGDLAAVLNRSSEQTVQTDNGITLLLRGASVTPRSVLTAQRALRVCADWFAGGKPGDEPDVAELRAIADNIGGDEVKWVRLLRECVYGSAVA